jgi:hypothetical protein
MTSRSNDQKQCTKWDFQLAWHESRLSNPLVLMASCTLFFRPLLSKRIDKGVTHIALIKDDGIVLHHPTTILEAIEQ